VVSRFVGEVRTACGQVAVQVVTGQGRQVLGIEHVGSAHADEDLALLVAAAQARLVPGQDTLDLPPGLEFGTKGQLAIDVSADALADGIRFDFFCGDEVYGNCTELRAFFKTAGQGVCAARPAELPPHPAWREAVNLRGRGQPAGRQAAA
jgi:hypothetical protein